MGRRREDEIGESARRKEVARPPRNRDDDRNDDEGE